MGIVASRLRMVGLAYCLLCYFIVVLLVVIMVVIMVVLIMLIQRWFAAVHRLCGGLGHCLVEASLGGSRNLLL